MSDMPEAFEMYQSHAYKESDTVWSISELWVNRESGDSLVRSRQLEAEEVQLVEAVDIQQGLG